MPIFKPTVDAASPWPHISFQPTGLPDAALPRRTRRIVAAFLIAWALGGCASYTVHPVSVRPPNKLAANASQDGIVAGAEPYFTAEQAEGAFDRDVTPHFMPVLIAVRNDTDEHIMVAKKEARLISSDGKTSKPVSWRTMYNAFNADVSEDTWALGVQAGSAAETSNNRMAADWQKKELGDQEVIRGGGSGAGGFIYFRKNDGQGPFTIRLVVEKLKSSDTVTVDMKLP